MKQLNFNVVLWMMATALLTGCATQQLPVTSNIEDNLRDMEMYYCEVDEDCALTEYNAYNCCPNPCGAFSFNKGAIEEIERWRDQNCGEDWRIISQFKREDVPNKWQSCFEEVECDIGVLEKYVPICIDNNCIINDTGR